MKKVILGIALLNQLVSGMDLPNSSSGGQEQQSNQLVSVTNARETTVAQLPVNDLQDMIRNSVREAISAVMGDQINVNTREFQGTLNVVSLRLRDAFQQQMNMQSVNFQTVLNRQEEEHRREMEAKDAQLEEARNEKIRVEKEKELLKRISRVFIANSSLKAERICERSVDIMQIVDLKTRHETIKGLYDKFVLFSDLFEQGGDLAILRKNVEHNQTNVIDKIPTKPVSHPLYAPNGWKPNQFDYLRKYFLAEYIDPILKEIKAGITGIDTAHGGWGYWLTPHAASLFNERIVGDINSHPNSRWEHDIETLKTRFILDTGNLDNLIVEFNYFIELLPC